MHGLDLSWPAKTVTFVLNYVFGVLGCAVAFGYIRFWSVAGADEGRSGMLLPSALGALAYLLGWKLLVPYVQSCEPEPIDSTLFLRGVAAFVYGVLTLLLVFILLR